MYMTPDNLPPKLYIHLNMFCQNNIPGYIVRYIPCFQNQKLQVDKNTILKLQSTYIFSKEPYIPTFYDLHRSETPTYTNKNNNDYRRS